MRRRLCVAVGLAGLTVLLSSGVAHAQQDNPGQANEYNARKAAAKAFAQRIDKLVESRWPAAKIKPTGPIDDGQFLRRLAIDLIGRIPDYLDVTAIRDREEVHKRELYMDKYLDGKTYKTGGEEDDPDKAYVPAYARHFANFWRAVFLSETNNAQFQQQGLQRGFELWLQQRLQSNVGYDKIAHELVSANAVGGGGATPGAFYFANENKAENLAGNTARIFLGVKIACAQCHKHPFAKWSKNQFWEYAAFFAGVQRGGKGKVNPSDREIRIPESDKTAKAKFLNGVEPDWKPGMQTRAVLADWMTAPDNPYFARAAVDHLWQYFFGVSLLEPIMEPNDDNPVTHPELLDELAKEFMAKQYDLKYLVRAIVMTKAYQRSSQGGTGEREEVWFLARMPVRGMSPEQLFDSFAEATKYNDPNANNPPQNQFQPGFQQSPRAQFLAKFTSQDKRLETQTSILQALYLMNSKFVNEQTSLANNEWLNTIAKAPSYTTPQRVLALYNLVLTRPPRQEETARLTKYIDSGGPSGDPRQAVADVYWALLNSAEFMLNH